MKSFFSAFLIAFSAVFLSGCGTAEVSNANSETNQNGAVSLNVNAGQPNTNAAPETAAEVPVFQTAEAALTAGNSYLDANETKKAIDAYKQAVKLDPDLAEGHFRLGIAYALVEDEEEAADIPEDDPVKKPKKSSKGKKGADEPKTNSETAFENAVKTYKKQVAKNPKDDVAFYNLGRSHSKLGEDEEAKKALEKAVKLKPEDTDYQTEYGSVLMNLAQYEEAVRALKKAIGIDETNLRAEELLAKAEAGRKRIEFGANKKK